MSEHNALLLTALQTPLKAGKRKTPHPGSGEVLVRVTAAGLNPHDSKGVEYGLFTKDYLPAAVLASDIAGTVVEVGSDVTKYVVKDRIMGQSYFLGGKLTDTAGLQEYSILDADHSAHIPSQLNYDDAGTLPVNTIASFVALFHPDQLGIIPPYPELGQTPDYTGQSLLIIGGGSQTGKFGIQFAHMAKFSRIITVASARNTDRLKAIGATHVIDRHTSDAEIEKQVRDIVGDDLIYAYDPVGEPKDVGTFQGPSCTLALACLSTTKKGKLATLIPGAVDEKVASTKKGGYQKTFASGMSHKHPDLMIPFWKHLPGWLEKGLITPSDYEVVEGLDAEKVNKFLDGYRDGKPVAKASIHP
ncbi:MAG: hypothetical protein Q9157_000313 [Trypethelium eluteriae]